MADPTPPTGEIVQPTVPVNTQPDKQTGEDLHPAEIRLNKEKAELKAENERLQALIKEQELSQLPEDEQIEEGFREAFTVRILNQIPAADFAKLPGVIQRQLQTNPWAFSPQEDIDQAGKFATNHRDYYTSIAPIAIENIKQLIEETTGPAKTEQNDVTKDPSAPTGGSPTEPGSYSEGQLRVIALTDPERYRKIMNAAKGK